MSLSNSKTRLSIPVETFEQFMLASDTADWPMSFAFEVTIDGQVSADKLQTALHRCSTKHPLLFSTLDASREHWNFNPDAFGPIDRVSADSPTNAMNFDLTLETGLKVFLRGGTNSHQTISFVFHHACVDGIGAMQFLNDVSQDLLLEPRAQNCPTLETHEPTVETHQRYLCRYRNSYGGNRLSHFLRWPLDLVGMLWSVEMIWNRPATIKPEQHFQQPLGTPPSPWLDSIGTLTCKFTCDETDQVKQLAKSTGQTLNDRIMESCFLAIADWNAKFNPQNVPSLCRIMVPMNLRRNQVPSAANMVAMVNFDRKTSRWNSARRFRKMLSLEMRAVKWIRAGVTANRFLQLQKKIFGYWPMLATDDRCLASCVVSNLGNLSNSLGSGVSDADQFGGLTIEQFQLIAPLRRNCNLFLCLFSHAGQLNLNFTYNARVLAQSQTEFLANSLKSHSLHD